MSRPPRLIRAARPSALTSTLGRSLVWGAVLFGACRTNLPDEVFYDGKSAGGIGPATGGAASSPGGSASAGVSFGSTGSVPSDGGEPNAPSSEAGAGGAYAAEAGAGGSSGEPVPDPSIDCGTPPIVGGPFTRKALRNAAAECASWHFCEFESAALTLESRVQRHAEAPEEATAELARAAWKRAMDVWSSLELFQFGPVASRAESAGKDVYHGQGLRELIYAWPSVARCRVEDQLIGQGFQKGFDNVLISSRGLYGLEYLLFYPGTESACPASSATAQSWAALGDAEVTRRKLAYSAALASDVRERAQFARNAFAPEGGNFQQAFIDAAGYPSEQEAMNVLGWALVYVEREVKDWKLGVPAGYTLTHPVSEGESPFAGVATQNIRANLRGFRRLFEGCGPNGEGLGFDDWLTEAGHAELAQDILHASSSAQSAAEAFPPFADATPAQVKDLYVSIKRLTDMLKTDLFGAGSPLNLKLPASVENDTD